MRRRSYLATIVGGAGLLSGCLSNPLGSDSNDQPDNANRRVRIIDFEGLPDDAPISFDVSVGDQWITDTATATFSVSTTNDTEEVRAVSPAFITARTAPHGSAGVLCYNFVARDFDIASYVPPCFGAESSPESQIPASYIDEEAGRVDFARFGYGTDDIAPGGEREESVAVIDDPTAEGCFPPGSYRVVDRVNDGIELSFEIEAV